MDATPGQAWVPLRLDPEPRRLGPVQEDRRVRPARIGDECPYGCRTALEHAILTAPEARDPAMVARLQAVAGRVLNR